MLRRLSLLLALAWMALLFYLSHQPAIDTPLLFPGQDKVAHATVYGILGMLLLGALPRPAGGYTGRQVCISTLLAGLYGMSDEIHQYFVPGRTADVQDWLADTLGALLGTLLLAQLSRVYKSAQPHAK